MLHKVRVHYDNKNGFWNPRIWIWVGDGTTLEREILPGPVKGQSYAFRPDPIMPELQAGLIKNKEV